MNGLKKISVIIVSLLAIGAVTLGVTTAIHSDLFTVQSVEVVSSLDDPPVDEQVILRLAAVVVGKNNLFDLDLKAIESRLLSNELIQGVRLQKRIPSTLQVSVVYREPQAIMQMSKGALSYVDREGKVFGSVNLSRVPDLPLLMGFNNQSPDRVREALRLFRRWEGSPLGQVSLISSIQWESERGFRILVTYKLGGKASTSILGQITQVRTMIDLGQEVASNLDGKLFRLLNVLRYLNRNSIAVRQIWADAGKKIVVKTVRGS